jgi:hypothetical protein
MKEGVFNMAMSREEDHWRRSSFGSMAKSSMTEMLHMRTLFSIFSFFEEHIKFPSQSQLSSFSGRSFVLHICARRMIFRAFFLGFLP